MVYASQILPTEMYCFYFSYISSFDLESALNFNQKNNQKTMQTTKKSGDLVYLATDLAKVMGPSPWRNLKNWFLPPS